RNASRDEGGVEVIPIGVDLAEQVDFPLALPGLDLPLAHNGFLHISVLLEPDEPVHVVPLGETRDRMFTMLRDAADKIVGDADIERPVSLRREKIDVVAPCDHLALPPTVVIPAKAGTQIATRS